MTDRTGPDPQEAAWVVDGLRYAGLIWGPAEGTPVLALHGWMDHAGSFAALAPRLTGCRVVALDLSGQGHSAWRSPDASYNIWDDLPQIAGLADQLGWEDFVLLGHSRGANIGTLFAAAQPHRVRALIALDSLVPVPTPAPDITATLRGFVEGTARHRTRPQRRYATRAAYVERRIALGNSRATAEALADRALQEDGDGHVLRADPRLMASSAAKLSAPQIEAVLRGLTMPVLALWAQDGMRTRSARDAEGVGLGPDHVADYTALDLPGDHHFHLCVHHAPRIAQAILGFLSDRTR